MTRPLSLLRDPPADQVPAEPIEFLRQLGGPTWIELSGRSAGRGRFVSTLLHGNEPSGLVAMHTLLRKGFRPARPTALYIASVDAALAEPAWSHRMLPGAPDANRCFREPFEEQTRKLARQVLDRVEAYQPECVIDLHNNTGHNPAYGVATMASGPVLKLTSFFADRVMLTDLRLGTLVEATAELCPSVTIECGRAGDPAADVLATRSLGALLERDDLELDQPPETPVRILHTPVRVTLREGVRIEYGEGPRSGESAEPLFTMRQGLDRHNFELLEADSVLGWAVGAGQLPIHAWLPDGRDCAADLFRFENGIVRTERDMIPIMMTLDPVIAAQDCLFYTADPASGPVIVDSSKK